MPRPVKALVSFFLFLASGVVCAQAWPVKPVRVIVPFGAGAPDTVARVLGQQLNLQTGQPFVVDNRPGANGLIGTEAVVKAPADGHTILVVSTSIVVNPSIYRKMPFDPLRDLEPVTNVCATEALIIGVHPSVPVQTVQELIALAKKPGERITFGSPGVGNTLHLAGELFGARAGIPLTHVPYKGAGPAIAALVAGEIQMMFMTPPLSLPQIKAGKVRPLAWTGRNRAKFLPDLPTTAEAGVADMQIDGGWHGVFVPAKTPPEIIATLHAELAKALKAPMVLERFASLGLEPIGTGPAEFKPFVAAQVKAYAEMVKIAGITPE